jgi:hypothetical protein
MPSLYDRTFGPTEEELRRARDPSFRMSSAGRRTPIQGPPAPGVPLKERVLGLGEAGATMATEMASAVPAGVATMMALPFEGVQGAAKRGQQVSEALTYLPRSEAGIGALEALEKPMAAMGAPGSAAGEEVMRRTGSPLLATATEMVVQPLNLLAAPMVGRGAVRGARAAGRAAKAAGRELGPKAAEMAEGYMRRAGMMPEVATYHGTPHTFAAEPGLPLGRFRSEKIGSGEGAQAFGHGLYLAESKDVADNYRKVLTAKHEADLWTDELRSQLPPAITRAELDEIGLLTRKMMSGNLKPQESARFRELQDRRAFYDQEVERLSPKGSLYSIDLPDPVVNRMLDWDAPMSEQPQSVLEALSSKTGVPVDAYRQSNKTGKQIWQTWISRRGNPQEAAAALQEIGIPGIRYLDRGSRKDGDGTRNYVVFPGEEQNLKILERDGLKLEQAKFETPEFRRFTAGAPMVKAAEATKHEFQTGKPVVIEGFSGTRRDFSEIDPAQSSAGYFLSSKPVVANEYAGVYPEGMGGGSFPTGGNIQRSFVRMDNPLFVNARGASFNRIDTRGIPGFGLPMSNTDMLNHWAKQQGYDGVIYKDLRDSLSRPGGQNAPASNVYVSFKPNYVKSAIGNRGTFDVQSRDMTKAQGGAVEGNMGYSQTADMIAAKLMDQGVGRQQSLQMALRMADAHMKAGGAVMMQAGGVPLPKRAPGVKSTSERAREQQAKRAEEAAKKKQEEAERVSTMPPVDRAAYGATQALEKAGVRVMPDAMRRMIEENTAAIAQKDPKLSLEEAAARAQRQAVQQLRWERVNRPAAQEQFGKLSPSTYNMLAQRRLRNLPEAVQERTEKAQAFLAKPTEPWTPPPGELQAFDRERIKDALEGFPGVEQSRFPRYEPKRANLDYVSEIYDDPVNRELIKKQIARGLPLGGETFYASLYPVKLAAMERGISPEKFDQFVYETAPASARNSILNEMAVGQFLRDMKARGLPLDEETVKAEMAQFKQKYGTGLPLMPVHREGVRKVIEEGRNLREMSKADIPTNYKIPTYGTQKAGDFGKSMVLDVHEAAGQTQGSRFHPYFTQQGGFSPKEYGLAEGKMLDIAQEMGVPGGMAQAGRWFGGGELTGLKSPRGDALDLLERQTAYTLQGQGVNPTPKAVRDYVLNMIETGEGVLMPYSKKAPIPDVRTRKAEGGEVTLRRGGKAAKGQSNAERARMVQQAREAALAREARPRTATAVAPHEYIPGAGVGLGESKVNAPLPVRQAYSQEISNVFKDQRDVDRLQKALGLAPAPTRAGTGAFRPSGGIPFQGMASEPARTQRMPLETQPAFATAAKVPLTRKGDDIEQSAKDKLAAAEAMRGYMTGQHGSTYNVQIPQRGGESMFVPLPKPADPDLMRLAYQMLDEDAFLADTGRGVNVLFNPYKDDNKPMTSAQRRRLKQYLGGSTTMPTKNVSDYIDFSEAWLGQQGSGAATKQMLERLEPLSAKDRAALSRESQDIAGGLYDIFTRESGKEPYRVDVMNALRVLRDKGLPGLTAALAAGEALPSE